MLVLFEPAKSADPPQNSGKWAAIALITCPEAARVATSLPGAKIGISASQPAGKDLVRSLESSTAFSGLFFSHAENFRSHALRN